MNRRWAAWLSTAALVGCVAETPTNNASSTTGTTTGTNSTTNAPSDDVVCLAGRYAQTVPFNAGNALPFTFDSPGGFGNLDASASGAVVVTTFDVADAAATGAFLNTTSVTLAADETRSAEDGWSRGAEEISIDFEGEPLTAWLKEGDDVDEINFYVPLADGDHRVKMQWRSPEQCPDERRDIRDLAVDTLAPNPSSTFLD